MGQSTDGILVFGVDLGEELPEKLQDLLDEFDGDFDTFLCKRGGIPSYGEEGHSFQVSRAFVETQPVTLVTHCSGEYPMYILGARASYQSASRGYANEATMTLSPESVVALTAFLAEFEVEEEPKWLLASYWS